jgi:hypothetical protein
MDHYVVVVWNGVATEYVESRRYKVCQKTLCAFECIGKKSDEQKAVLVLLLLLVLLGVLSLE